MCSRTTFLLSLLTVCTPSAAPAQELVKFEIAGEMSGARANRGYFRPDSFIATGIGPRVTFNLNDRIGIEGFASAFPEHSEPEYQVLGGQAFHAGIGLRTTFLAKGRWSVHGMAAPGMVRFSDTIVKVEQTEIPGFRGQTATVAVERIGSASHFALFLTGGVRLRLWDRVTARIDVGTALFTYESTQTGDFGPLFVFYPGGVASSPRVSWNLAYGLGGPVAAARRRTGKAAWTLGGQVTSLSFAPRFGDPLPVRRAPGLGVFIARRMAPALWIDGTLSVSGGPEVQTTTDGGRTTQALVGVKAGFDADRLAAFVKMRVGVTRHSSTISAVHTAASSLLFTYNPLTERVVDIGGVLEISMSHRTLLRLDAGTTIALPMTSSFDFDGAIVTTRLPVVDRLAFAAGIGRRF